MCGVLQTHTLRVDVYKRAVHSAMIGVLAGMGPRSTSPFLEKVLDECVAQYGARFDADFPPMMIHSLPTPFVVKGDLDHDAMRESIRRGLERLAATGVDLIAIPCNVAHVDFEKVVAGLEIPVLNLVRIAAEAIPVEAGDVAVLATHHTVAAGLYNDALQARGLGVRRTSSYQAHVDELIEGVKASRPDSELEALWEELIAILRRDGVGSVLLGSTELSALATASRESRIPVVDSGSALARELIRHWREIAGIEESSPESPRRS